MNIKKLLTVLLSCLMMFVLAPNSTVGAEEEKETYIHDISELTFLPYEDTLSLEEMNSLLLSRGLEPIKPTESNMFRSASQIRYAVFSMETYSYSSTIHTYKIQPLFYIGLEYYSGIDSPDRMVNISNAKMRTSAGGKCVFSGRIHYHLESGNSFSYFFSGDLYQRGGVNWSAGAKVGIGEQGSVQLAITNGDGFIKNVDGNSRYYSAGMNP